MNSLGERVGSSLEAGARSEKDEMLISDCSSLDVPSPLPSPDTSPSTPSSTSKSPSPSLPPSPSFHTPTFSTKALPTSVKHRIATRLKWPSVIIPFVLILVGASVRCISHPSMLDIVGLGSAEADVVQPVAGARNEFGLDESAVSIHKRQPAGSSISIFLPTATSSASSSGSTSGSPTSTSSGPIAVPTIPSSSSQPVLPTPFPQPWDTSGLTLNFSTQGCLGFFQNMTNTEAFRSCRNFGMLEAWSNDFTNAQTNLTLLNNILWGTCNPPLGADQCTANMRWFERELVKDDVCGKELDERNESVVRSRAALLAYPLLLSTSCLSLSNTNVYCYVSSIAAGASGTSDIFLYSLPLGDQFPNGTSIKPSCSPCEKNLLGVFGGQLMQGSTSSSITSDPDATLNKDDTSSVIGLKETYQNAVNTVEATCGQGFVQIQGAQGSHSSGGVEMKTRGMGRMGWFIVVGLGVIGAGYGW